MSTPHLLDSGLADEANLGSEPAERNPHDDSTYPHELWARISLLDAKLSVHDAKSSDILVQLSRLAASLRGVVEASVNKLVVPLVGAALGPALQGFSLQVNQSVTDGFSAIQKSSLNELPGMCALITRTHTESLLARAFGRVMWQSGVEADPVLLRAASCGATFSHRRATGTGAQNLNSSPSGSPRSAASEHACAWA